MTLLVDFMERPLDPGYAAAAARREAAGLPRSTGRNSPLLVAFAVVVGLLFAVARQVLIVPETTEVQQRDALVAQIEDRRERVDRQASALAGLRQQVEDAQTQALRSASQGALADQLAALEAAAGPLGGPGLRVTVDDAEPAGGASGTDPGDADGDADADDGRVLSADLQLVVNGLWQAGAEAVAVNGHRLTSRSAIRFAGEAILVDYRPLTRPYVIEAIGDPRRLPVAFAESQGGEYLASLRSNLGIRGDVEEVARLRLPPASSAAVNHARIPGRTASPAATSGGIP